MYSEEAHYSPPTQITFHYTSGHSESFVVDELVHGGGVNIRQEIRRFLNEGWWIVKLGEETVFINANNVTKLEVKPPFESLEGEGVISMASRITALSRAAR